MCGIVGVVTKTNYGFQAKHVDMFEQMLRADELRGEDSTGIIYVENDSSFGILKEASPASWSANNMLKDKMLSDTIRLGKALIGHNRKATLGRITDETAHPFVVNGTFAQVHNGTLRQHKVLKDTEVDSEALAHLFADVLKGGVEKETLEEVVGKVDGAYATASYQQENNTVYLLRNLERPLYFLELPDCYVWGSEAGMVLWIAGRNGYDLTKTNGFLLKEHTLLSINLDKNKVDYQEFVPKKATPPAIQSGGTVSTAVRNTAAIKPKTQGGLSKQEFKRIKRRFLGNRHSFFVDDWVEKNYPRSLEQGETEVLLMGGFDSELFSGVSHNVNGIIDLTEAFGSDAPDDFADVVYSGTIYEVTRDVGTGILTFMVNNIKAFPKSTLKQTMDKVVYGKWTALPPPAVETPTMAPDLMTTDEWKKATATHRYDINTEKWILRHENSTTLH